MSRREEFKSRMKELKQYKDTTGKGYWEWKKQPKVRAYYFGGDNDPEGEEQKDDVFAQFIKKNPMQPGSTPPAELSEQNRIENLPYEQNEYQKQFAKAWYTQRAKYDKYKSQLGGDKLDAVLQNVDKSTYQTLPQYAETALNEYARLNNIDRAPNPIEIEMKTEQLQKNAALGFTMPDNHVWHVKPKTVKTKRFDNRGLGWHEGIGHVVGDNSEQILQSAPRIFVKSKNGNTEYDKYTNQLNEQHASTWEFRGANAEMLDDYGKRYIDPSRQLNSYDIRKMIEKGATLPVQWRDSGITEAQIAEFLNSFAYNDQEVIDNSSNDYSLQFDKVLTAKNGGQIPAYKEGGDTEDNLMTTIVTNTVRKALERGDIALAKKMLRRGNRDSKEFHYPDNGSITPLLNLYDTPLLGDALSLLDAIKYSVKGDWDNASTSYMDAVTPLALFNKSKLNWKQWGAKKKYIPEYTAIEYQAKKNGTWLKNPDGSDFTGDPREWVVKQSKKFKEAFGDKYKEGYTGMRNPYDPNSKLDTYLASRDRAYTYTQNKREVKKKGDSGVAKLVVPDTDTYTVDAFGNDWLHLTDKSVNPYNFTNTNQIVSNIQTPTISFKNIRDDGPFGVRDVAEDQFVIKANTPRKSVLYNNGDFDLSNPDIFKTTITPYVGYKLYNKANRENTQSYAIGGETDQPDIYTDERTDHPIAVRQNLDRDINVANYIDRINHIDPNIEEYNPFYTASDDTYGTVSIPEVTVTAPWTKQGRNNADARRGMHYVQQGLEDAAKVAAPIVAGAALPAMASTGALGTITDLASIVTNPTDPLNYLPYAKYLDKYIFLRHTNSFTRGIGGEQGLQDLIESELVRGNPIGTEITAHNFAKMYRKNRGHFRDIMDGTKREGIHNRYYNRTLSKDDFEAIKKQAKLFENSYIKNKVGKINLHPIDVDPLSRYEDYENYLQVLKQDRQTLQNATSLDDSGQPLAYFYDDGRNPLTEGHDYAKSIYGVRVNNASSYNPRIFEGHLHYSFPQAISLYDPNVEVFKRGFLGITTKINKNKLYRYLNNSN